MNNIDKEKSIYICSLLKPVDQYWFRFIDNKEKQDSHSLSHYDEKQKLQVEAKCNKSLYNKSKIKKRVSNKKWIKEEEDLLVKLCGSKIKKKWRKISKIIGNKTIMQCIYKYRCLLKRNKIKSSKTESEDVLLTNKKVKDYFSQNFYLNFSRVSGIKTNCKFSFDFPPKLENTPIKPIVKLATLEYINSTLIKQNSKGKYLIN
jgi:hypothetical protein